eukprot:CAMPEP_0113942456 /NCGR_PEP_ID=MMETSP1339-20121228/8169_1 /TAXON_ID=94617 /ORGANISM="Fibrocapsa japonica" /LENGTH=526 /DNA_ID=CAMNT_0000946943 /DNA_START=73 /DNA_END=1653 /DNA_ORIENTATION=+ /assembly_acc=CAM_ASM_000762
MEQQNDTSDDPDVTEIESLCMNCEKNGITRLLLTKVPYFRELILMSFYCDECGFQNNEVQFGGEIQEKGCKHTVTLTKPEDLNRQVIKSDFATITFPELDFEIPAKTQRGEITTVEGILSTAAKHLGQEQAYRMEVAPEVGMQVAEVIAKLARYASGDCLPFTLILDDPAGNSFVENPQAPVRDPQLVVDHYRRLPSQDLAIGLQPTQQALEDGFIDDKKPEHQARSEGVVGAEGLIFDSSADVGRKEVIAFPENCCHCGTPGQTNMCVTDIPHFKEVIIMAFDCGNCGFKSNEVKGGGAIPPRGCKTTLRAESEKDLQRDVLKSDSAGISIPELEMEMEAGSLGGLYTSVEGLLVKMRENLLEGNPFTRGDSAVQHHDTSGNQQRARGEMDRFLQKLEDVKNGKVLPFTLEVKDPLANSFIGPRRDDTRGNIRDDPLIQVEEYERSFQENEDLGLHDINTENYAVGSSQVEVEVEQPVVGPTEVADHPHHFTKGCEDDTPGPEAAVGNGDTDNSPPPAVLHLKGR